MTAVIYADVFFAVNFSMDFLALALVGRLTHRAASLWRIVLAAALGGLYAIAALFLPSYIEAPLTLFFPFVMATVTFGIETLWSVVKNGLFVFAVSFAIGGVMTAVYYLIGRLLTAKGIVINGSVETLYSELPLWVLGLVALLAAAVAAIWTKAAQRAASKRSTDIVIGEGGREITLRAFCDSGNLLEEPLGHLPVIVVGKETMLSFLPPTLSPAFFSKELNLDRVSPRHMVKMRFIPVVTVGNKCLLRGYIPDYVKINGEKKKACIALDADEASFDGFQAIMPCCLL